MWLPEQTPARKTMQYAIEKYIKDKKTNIHNKWQNFLYVTSSKFIYDSDVFKNKMSKVYVSIIVLLYCLILKRINLHNTS